MEWLHLFIGGGLMLVGGDWLVRGTVGISRKRGLSEFIISVIVIGIGTSMPEIFVSLISGHRDLGTLVISNNISSNIVDIWGVIGVGAFLTPIILDGRKHIVDFAFLWIATAIFTVMCLFRVIGWMEAIVLFGIFAAYLFYAIRAAKEREPDATSTTDTKSAPPPGTIAGVLYFFQNTMMGLVMLVLFGIGLIYIGSERFMDALQIVARVNHLDQTLAGLLIVGPGTSMPELIVTILAAIRRRPQIAVGNIIGSNLMNIALVVPIGALVIDLPTSKHISYFDVWVMCAALVMLSLNLFVWKKISRWTAVLYMSLLVLYMWAAIVIRI
ncbi:MAG: sodium:calcium antiporter [Alphaproteobacteria bacterium]|nr:sodium:calcium antiporter [Alphaproteobacteria bacterium]